MWDMYVFGLCISVMMRETCWPNASFKDAKMCQHYFRKHTTDNIYIFFKQFSETCQVTDAFLLHYRLINFI